MAVGISCAGTGRREAQLLIEPLLTDAVDFVRQGAFVATALVMLQQPESQVSNPAGCRLSCMLCLQEPWQFWGCVLAGVASAGRVGHSCSRCALQQAEARDRPKQLKAAHDLPGRAVQPAAKATTLLNGHCLHLHADPLTVLQVLLCHLCPVPGQKLIPVG